jgi:uncharacterized protein (TIGR03067 family)
VDERPTDFSTAKGKEAVLFILKRGKKPAADGGANQAAARDKGDLPGKWVAVSIEVNGKPAPPAEVKQTRFEFKAGKLLVRGSRKDDDREEAGTYKTDAAKSPKQLDFTLRKKTCAGIYEVKGKKLKICFENGGNLKNRPTRFATNREQELVLIVFRRERP